MPADNLKTRAGPRTRAKPDGRKNDPRAPLPPGLRDLPHLMKLQKLLRLLLLLSAFNSSRHNPYRLEGPMYAIWLEIMSAWSTRLNVVVAPQFTLDKRRRAAHDSAADTSTQTVSESRENMVIPDFAVLEILGITDDLLKLLDEFDFSANLWPLLHVVQVVVRALVESKRPVPKDAQGSDLGEQVNALLSTAKQGAITQAKQLFRTRFRAEDKHDAGSKEVILVANTSEYWSWTVVKPEGTDRRAYAEDPDSDDEVEQQRHSEISLASDEEDSDTDSELPNARRPRRQAPISGDHLMFRVPTDLGRYQVSVGSEAQAKVTPTAQVVTRETGWMTVKWSKWFVLGTAPSNIAMEKLTSKLGGLLQKEPDLGNLPSVLVP